MSEKQNFPAVKEETAQKTDEDLSKKLEVEHHEFAEMFPPLIGDDYLELRNDIKAKGLKVPIVRYKDKILDGRNRKKVCDELGIEPRYVDYTDDDPLGYVLSMNLHRRHLNESQRAMIAAGLVNTRRGERTDLGGDLASGSELPVNLPKVTQEDAAKKMKVSEKSVRNAKKVKEEGTDEQIEAINDGSKTINKVMREIEQAKKADEPAETTPSALTTIPVAETSANPPLPKIFADYELVSTTPSTNAEPAVVDMSETKAPAETGPEDAGNAQQIKGEEDKANVPQKDKVTPDALVDELAQALALPIDSSKRSLLFMNVIVSLIEDCFTKDTARQKFLENLQAEFVKLGL